jgi:hypothetical protein
MHMPQLYQNPAYNTLQLVTIIWFHYNTTYYIRYFLIRLLHKQSENLHRVRVNTINASCVSTSCKLPFLLAILFDWLGCFESFLLACSSNASAWEMTEARQVSFECGTVLIGPLARLSLRGTCLRVIRTWNSELSGGSLGAGSTSREGGGIGRERSGGLSARGMSRERGGCLSAGSTSTERGGLSVGSTSRERGSGLSTGSIKQRMGGSLSVWSTSREWNRY